MILRFNIKWLLAAITICAILAWWVSQMGMTVAHVIVVDNRLELNDQGTVDGQLQCQLVEATNYSFSYSDFLCIIYHVDRPDLVDLKSDQRARIEYRRGAVLPWMKQDDPYRIFINRYLNIPDAEILGAVRLDGWMEIKIRGAKKY